MSPVELNRPEWAVDPAEAARVCSEFLKTVLSDAGKERLVIGLSGGIDSAVAAGLAVRALGAEHVSGLMLPYATSAASSLADARSVAAHLGIESRVVPITPMADAFLADHPDADPLRRGNVMARCRMVVLYDWSAKLDALVLGTGNRTEALLGYTTVYGDNACALNPLGNLYKTEVRLLSQWLGLPDAVLTKAPSADLWEGQSDEEELGFTYAQADEMLHAIYDLGRTNEELVLAGFDAGLVARMVARVRAMAFKRQLPPVAPLPGRPDPDASGETA